MSKAILEMYLANKNASQDKLEELKAGGVVVQFALQHKETKEITKSRVYIQKPELYGRAGGHHQVMNLLNTQLPLVLYGLALFPSPKTAYFSVEPSLIRSGREVFADKVGYGYLSNSLSAISTKRQGHYNIGLLNEKDQFWVVTSATIDQMSKEVVRDLVGVDESFTVTNPLPMTNFRFLPAGTSREQIENIQKEIGRINQCKPTPLSHWILMPQAFYSDDEGLALAALNAFRYGSQASTYREFVNDSARVAHQLNTHKILHRAKSLIRNVAKLREYITRHSEVLDEMIHNEVMAMRSAKQALNVTHYHKTLFNIAFTKLGWMKSSAFEWSTYTDSEYHRDFNNSLFDSVLPEITASTANKNPMNRVMNVTSLISNFNLREVPINQVYNQRFRTPEEQLELEKIWCSAAKALIPTSSLSIHQTTITNDAVFTGYFEGIPSIDEEKYSAHMQALMQSEKGAKLSGCQYKLPVTLSVSNGQLHLKRQQGSEPFTHIAKMPHPELEMLTLSEWLSLRILKDAGLPVAKNQLVGYANNHQEFNRPSVLPSAQPRPYANAIDEEDALFEEIGLAFKEQMRIAAADKQSMNAKIPPFLISERFDIPYESEIGHSNVRVTSIDLGALCMIPFGDKYKPSFEQIAESIQKLIPCTQVGAINQNIYEQIIASCLLHNNDLHVKNMTVLAKEDVAAGKVTYEMSPIYDVLITPMVFPGIDKKSLYGQALSIDGTKCPTKAQIIEFGIAHLNISSDKATQIFQRLEDNIFQAVVNLKQNLPSELSKNALWNDALVTGLLMVQRNLEHVREHGKTYGYFESHENQLSMQPLM